MEKFWVKGKAQSARNEAQTMRAISEVRCSCCGKLFSAGARNAWHQKYCTSGECGRASKAASNLSWRLRNAGYDRGPAAVRRTQEWRASHPGYSRTKKISNKAGELRALQDVILRQPLVIIGLIAQMRKRSPKSALSLSSDGLDF